MFARIITNRISAKITNKCTSTFINANVNSFYLSYQYQGKSILRKRMEIQEEKMMAFFCFLARKQRKKVILWFLAKTKVKKNHNY